MINKMMIVLVGVALTFASCSKTELPIVEEMDSSMEILARQPAPGIYTIFRFTDTGDNETAQFAGYTFEFQADGDLIATTNTGAIFNGFWDLNGAETMMEISIGGTPALDDLDDDDWTINRITNKKIGINAPGPDLVQFSKMP